MASPAKRELTLTLAVAVALAVLPACTTSTPGEISGASPPTFVETTPPTFAEEPPPTFAEEDASTTAPPTTETPADQGPDGPATGDLAARIGALRSAPEASGDSYDRDLFGGGWIDADSDGCDTRCEVLAEETRTDLAGLAEGWYSLYDGYSTDDPSELDIDHVVALGEAWRSGADQWDQQRREAYANDIDVGQSLIAVSASTNRSKSDRDPASWQPPSLDGWCEFLAAWVNTKLRWDLTADPGEITAMTNMATSRDC